MRPEQAFDLRQALHVATLDALLASRRWEPGELLFQGGTSLHLAHGSPRFSEDLDFLVNSSPKLESLSKAVRARLEGAGWLAQGLEINVTPAKEGRNPHAFVVSIGGAEVIGAVRVKVELWKTQASTMAAMKAVVVPVRLANGPAAGMQAFVPTAELPEIYANKVFALAARPYMKARDVFDLYWLKAQGNPQICSKADMLLRLATYPNETPDAWLNKSSARLLQLQSPAEQKAMETDLKRWLPSAWLLDLDMIKGMCTVASQALEQGMEVMQEISADRSALKDALPASTPPAP
jgi:predicted nucleotidyltransferase component of viral defense system